ncbi:uncharacterized protein [Chamaea fasciata]|uniref:uncharacterized protein isoform X4 n=1 Tax=Chamaea fasciata TaxID=190680 RepID=UPI00336AD69F
MTQQETYGNWLGPKRLVRQPGIYSVAGKMSPLGDFRPASPDSFEDDYDDVSMAGSERGPPAKGVYLLAGPPGSSPAPSLKNSQDFEPKLQDLGPKLQDSDPKSANLDLKSGDLDPNWGVSRPGAWNSVTVSLLVLLGLSGLAWAALLGLGLAERECAAGSRGGIPPGNGKSGASAARNGKFGSRSCGRSWSCSGRTSRQFGIPSSRIRPGCSSGSTSTNRSCRKSPPCCAAPGSAPGPVPPAGRSTAAAASPSRGTRWAGAAPATPAPTWARTWPWSAPRTSRFF